MALQFTNINELKNSQLQIELAKTTYEDTIKNLRDAIKNTEQSWQGEDAYNYRIELNDIINKKLQNVIDEMNFEIDFLKKTTSVLQDAQERVKNKLNG